MDYRYSFINWIMVIDVVFCLIVHRMFLKSVEVGSDTSVLADALQISIISILFLFLFMFAELAVYAWKKVSTPVDKLGEIEVFPKVSFICGSIAFFIFSAYWVILSL